MLGEAVGQCVEAAGHEYDPHTQKSLLRVRAMDLLTGSCVSVPCCTVLFCPPGGVIWKVLSDRLQSGSVCGHLQRTASPQRRPREQRGAAADTHSVSSNTGASWEMKPASENLCVNRFLQSPLNSLTSDLRFKQMTLQVLIDR